MVLEKEQKLRASILTLHKYFIWATQMREHFYTLLMPTFDATPNLERFSEEGLKIDLYMSLWYGQLYVVAEGWQELKLSDTTVDNLLTSANLALLKRYRNGTFHFQKNYFDDRFLGLMQRGVDVAVWARNLHDAFGSYFLTTFAEWKISMP